MKYSMNLRVKVDEKRKEAKVFLLAHIATCNMKYTANKQLMVWDYNIKKN